MRTTMNHTVSGNELDRCESRLLRSLVKCQIHINYGFACVIMERQNKEI